MSSTSTSTPKITKQIDIHVYTPPQPTTSSSSPPSSSTPSRFPVSKLNELEYINNKVWANVWFSNYIHVIDPVTGRVERIVSLSLLHTYVSYKPACLILLPSVHNISLSIPTLLLVFLYIYTISSFLLD